MVEPKEDDKGRRMDKTVLISELPAAEHKVSVLVGTHWTHELTSIFTLFCWAKVVAAARHP